MRITDEMKDMMEDAIAQYSSGGTVEKKKVGTLFRACGLNPTEAQMADWKKECGGGDVSVDKFKQVAISKLQDSGDSVDEIIDAFSVFDKDGTGTIPIAEFKHICTGMGEALSEREMAEVIRELDTGTGMLNYKVFAEQIYNL